MTHDPRCTCGHCPRNTTLPRALPLVVVCLAALALVGVML